MAAPFSCGRHTAEFRALGGESIVGAAEPLLLVRYNRIRDDISHCEITLPMDECCDLMSEIGTVRHELHIFRDGDPVWEGPITRIEYDFDVIRVFAEDILWVAKKHTIEGGYDHSHPNIGNVIDDMHWTLLDQCFAKNGDPWRMTTNLHPVYNEDAANDPREARVVFPYATTAWEDFDKYAEDYGADYTVISRTIYYWDINLAWNVIPSLDEQWISAYPRIVEYGNQLITRAIVTNGKGYAGMAVTADDAMLATYGYIDDLTTNVSEGSIAEGPPSVEDISTWMETAQRKLLGAAPSPMSIVIPANTTLLPGSPWSMAQLVPGSWFKVSVNRMCRVVTDWQRLHEIIVEETATSGETINFTAIAAPGSAVFPTPPVLQETDVANYIFESQTVPKEYGAVFFGTGDQFGRTIELQWSGDGTDPEVMARIALMEDQFGPRHGLLLVGVKNNRLHAKHAPADIIETIKPGGWTDADFAP